MKKGNLFKAFIISAIAAFGILNVKAANTYVDASTCEGGRVYTNYYFFLDANSKMTTDYTTIGYYSNSVFGITLQNIVNRYGIFSEEFARVANRGYGIVPIDTYNQDYGINIDGIGIRTFYKMLTTIDMQVSGRELYLVDHNWSKIQNRVVREENSDSINFSTGDIERMIQATVILRNYPTISPISNPADGDYPVQIQINRKYSLGTLKKYSKIKPISIYSDNQIWDAYLQPALFYFQYCEKRTTSNGLEFIHYEPNAGKDTVKYLPIDNAFDTGSYGYISSGVPVRNGYTFLGWSRNSDAVNGDPDYAGGRRVYNSMTLYAIWKKNDTANTYSVVYRPNTTDTVTNMPASVTKNVGENVKISEVVPARNGYTFLGWSSVSGASAIEKKYNGGSIYKDGKDLILYAVWKKKTSGNNIVNPATGVEEYIIPFSSAVTASLVGLKVLKKKKSFMQF